MLIIVATIIIANWPPERWHAGTPTAHAKNVKKGGEKTAHISSLLDIHSLKGACTEYQIGYSK